MVLTRLVSGKTEKWTVWVAHISEKRHELDAAVEYYLSADDYWAKIAKDHNDWVDRKLSKLSSSATASCSAPMPVDDSEGMRHTTAETERLNYLVEHEAKLKLVAIRDAYELGFLGL
jgi:hypothetical protein